MYLYIYMYVYIYTYTYIDIYIYILIYIYVYLYICLVVSRFEFLYQQYFGFLLSQVSGSRNYPIVHVNSKKDSWCQDYSVYKRMPLLHIGTVIRQSCKNSQEMGTKRLNANCVYFGWKIHESNYKIISHCAISMDNHSEKVVSQMHKSWSSMRSKASLQGLWSEQLPRLKKMVRSVLRLGS